MAALFPLQIRYVAVGIWNTLIGFGLFTILIHILPKAQYLLALVIATIIGGIHSFIMQRTYVWKSGLNVKLEFIKFSIVFISQFILNLLVLYVLVEYMNYPPLYTQYFVGGLIITMTYLIHKHWTFK